VCGICGYLSREPLPAGTLGRMCAALRHRGPDDTGFFESRADGLFVGLGHARLSIIDVEGGHQPIANEDGSIVIVQNGEVYNYGELRRALVERGHRFRTRSDAESVLHLYEEAGMGFLDELRGMFAFAIWDGRARSLLLVRDRLGQKPLFYYRTPNGVIFASEINALLQSGVVPRRVNAAAISHYLTYQYVPHPLTAFEGIMKLPPAHYLRLTANGAVEKRRYWLPRVEPDESLGEERCSKRVRALLEESVRLRLMSDVPVGAFLSGGVDSSIIVSLMSRQGRDGVQTFSIGFEEEDYNELPYARLVARANDTTHREFVVRSDAVEVLPELVWRFGEPFADSSAIPTYYVAKMTSEFVKVALTGEGGDECFAGYPRYKAVRLGCAFDGLPRALRGVLKYLVGARRYDLSGRWRWVRRAGKLFYGLRFSPAERYYFWVSIFDDAAKLELCTPDFLRHIERESSFDFLAQYYELAKDADMLTATMFVDMMTYLPCDLLTKVDITGMANSLEVRSPFLDHRLIEFVLKIPPRLKMRALKGKRILKRACGDILPREILRRRKHGFGVPVSEWMRGELEPLLRDLLLDGRTLSRGYFRPDAVARLVEEHIQGRADNGARLWALLVLEIWHRQYIDPPDAPRKVTLSK